MQRLVIATYTALAFMSAIPPGIACSQVEFVEKMNREFLSRKPLVGEAYKDVKVFDDQGNTIQLSSTRGKHTVLIFGCLT